MTTRKVTMQPAGSYYRPIEFTIGADGVARNEIDRPAMEDMVKHLLAQGAISATEAANTNAAYSAVLASFLNDYRANHTGPSDEERAEARAAHGRGVRMTNIVTGTKWTT